ncbi:acyl carrier protein [Candidatus Phytoplasma luffae]|uniref:Acyl carrier protein n=1 Tax=Loofah witches'-broom phytoplasma TaxID=35773 RepID=A0A975FIQ5_LOWBP|nr:acyl carrier protein [Candidatus Phytoplasma luffae]QTX02771.1 acyl carrier protein [Candidatus Phytoplasma luffae]
MVFTTIKNILCKKINVEEIKLLPETRLKEDLGLDSFDAVELVIDLEKSFNLKISDETMQQFKTIKDVVYYIEKNYIN